MVLLSFILAWALIEAGRELASDTKHGLRNAGKRAQTRVAAIRADRNQPRWKRHGLTAAVWSGQTARAAGRGTRTIGRSAARGWRRGVQEGQRRYDARREAADSRDRAWRESTLGSATAEQPRGGPRATIRRVRDKSGICPSCGHGCEAKPARWGCGCENRDCRCDTERASIDAGTAAVLERLNDPHAMFTPPASGNQDDPGLTPAAEQPGAQPDYYGAPCAKCGRTPDRDELDPGLRCRACRHEQTPTSQSPPRHDDWIADDGASRIRNMPKPDTNGETPMSTPSSLTGEATNIEQTRAALQSFSASAASHLDTASNAAQEAQSLAAAADQMLGGLTTADLDAQTLSDVASLQEQAAALQEASSALQQAAEGTQVGADTALQGLNERHSQMEEAVNATPHAATTGFYRH